MHCQLVEWNRTEVPWPQDKCIHQLFEDQAVQTPDAVAVELAGKTLTYRQLNERANQLAHFLRREGVGPNSFVGIAAERSLEFVVGIYGVLKAGGAYVPLDPAYPQDRLNYMIETAQVKVLLTQAKLTANFNTLPDLRCIQLDADWDSITNEPVENPSPVVTPNDLIYVIFTSGSTGRPKAAGVYHRGFTNLMHWFVTEFSITAADRVILVSSLSFDLTQKNLYAPLIRGGTLHLYPHGPYDVTLLARLISQHGITLINCTPSAFYPLLEPLDEAALQNLASLRVVFLGGESISIPRLRPWLSDPTCRAEIANTYGPTECTDICGSYRMSKDTLDRYDMVPLGRPIYNVQLAIVDSAMRFCPVGEAGELCVAGTGIGAGYLNDPAMTAAKFVTNPFPEIRGRTLYRTGDQARWLPSGVIEFLGRLDHQVKIRGFRIELHEIESAVNTHPSVRESIVIVKRTANGPGDPRLVCFYTSKDSEPPKTTALKTYLKELLPKYMVPPSFQVLTKFPLSPNGKVDRNALNELPDHGHAAPPAPILPSSELEDSILQVWVEVLHSPEVNLDDSFFDLHGNSLHLAELHARLQKLVEREFPITELFEHTTVRGQAAHFGAKNTASSGNSSLHERARRQREALATRRTVRR